MLELAGIPRNPARPPRQVPHSVAALDRDSNGGLQRDLAAVPSRTKHITPSRTDSFRRPPGRQTVLPDISGVVSGGPESTSSPGKANLVIGSHVASIAVEGSWRGAGQDEISLGHAGGRVMKNVKEENNIVEELVLAEEAKLTEKREWEEKAKLEERRVVEEKAKLEERRVVEEKAKLEERRVMEEKAKLEERRVVEEKAKLELEVRQQEERKAQEVSDIKAREAQKKKEALLAKVLESGVRGY